jgi:hypothetical protein
MIIKVRKLSFAIIHSTTIALPAWCNTCVSNLCPICLISHDVKTWWNSTYDMLKVAHDYCVVIDDITANKVLKPWKYKLDDEDWDIIKDLLQVLKVYLFHQATLVLTTCNSDIQGCHIIFLSG